MGIYWKLLKFIDTNNGTETGDAEEESTLRGKRLKENQGIRSLDLSFCWLLMFSRAAFRVVGGDFTMVIQVKRQRENKMTELVKKNNLSAEFIAVIFFFTTETSDVQYSRRMILWVFYKKLLKAFQYLQREVWSYKKPEAMSGMGVSIGSCWGNSNIWKELKFRRELSKPPCLLEVNRAKHIWKLWSNHHA